jgi:hypothetical protein
MTTVKLLKLAPTLIMTAVMAFSMYSINPQVPPGSVSSSPGTAPTSSGGDRPDPGTHQVSDAVATGLKRGRNPFVVLFRPGRVDQPGVDPTMGSGARVDPYLALVQGLTLNATFVQGKTQIASINGRLYERGQYMEGSGDERSLLVVVQVTPAEVVLEANGRRYRLGYPDGLISPTDRPPGAAGTGRPSLRAGPGSRSASTHIPKLSRDPQP